MRWRELRRPVVIRRFNRLREDVVDDVPVVDLESFAAGVLQPVAVQSEQVEHRGVEVGDVVPFAQSVVTEFVGGAVDVSLLDARSSEPDREPVGMMIAARRATGAKLQPGRPSKLGAEHNQRLVHQAPLFQILNQTGDREVDIRAQSRVILLELLM